VEGGAETPARPRRILTQIQPAVSPREGVLQNAAGGGTACLPKTTPTVGAMGPTFAVSNAAPKMTAHMASQDVVTKLRDQVCAPDKDLHFFLGNFHGRPWQFSIVGLWWPKKKPVDSHRASCFRPAPSSR
jgi:hypothetical protein